MTDNKVKVIIAKIGPDDHTRGVGAVSHAMRDAGMEVIYMGSGQRIEGVIATAVQEDVDVIGLGFHCGGQLETVSRMIAGLRERGLGDISVIVGGMIPTYDIVKLREMGVAAVFPPGSSLQEMIEFVRSVAGAKRGAANALKVNQRQQRKRVKSSD